VTALVVLGILAIAATNSPHVASASSAPVAAFTWEPCVMCAVPGFLVMFNANWSQSPSGLVQVYVWDFGDGSPTVKTTSPQTSHDYPNAPTMWLVTLTIQDSASMTSTVSQWVLFYTVPRFNFQPLDPSVSQQVTFNGSSSISYQGTNPIKSYNWDFGDGTGGAGVVVSHTYTNQGLYRVSLTLSTPDGNPTASKTILVRPFTIAINKTIAFDGVTLTITANFTLDAAAGTLTGTALVIAVNNTSGETIFSKSFNVTISISSSRVDFVLPVAVTPFQLGVDCAINTVDNTGDCVVSRTPDVNQNGRVDSFDLAMLLAHYGTVAGSSSYSPVADLNANGKVDVFDLATLLAYYHAQVLT
jgi:PKD repeat protein